MTARSFLPEVRVATGILAASSPTNLSGQSRCAIASAWRYQDESRQHRVLTVRPFSTHFNVFNGIVRTFRRGPRMV